MLETKKLMTAEELAQLPSGEGQCYELVNGELRTMSAAGFQHGDVTFQIGIVLAAFVLPRQLGRFLAAETGFLLRRQPDHVRAPDIAFVTHDRLPPAAQRRSFLELAPDFVVEVVSPSDSWTEVTAKVTDWLEYGVRIVWVVDPITRSVEIWRSPERVDRRRSNDEVDAEPVLPGFRCTVNALLPAEE